MNKPRCELKSIRALSNLRSAVLWWPQVRWWARSGVASTAMATLATPGYLRMNGGTSTSSSSKSTTGLAEDDRAGIDEA